MHNLEKIYRNKKVLVTGHTGFKGSWLILWLHQLGADIIGYSLEPPTKPNLFESLNLQSKITHIIGNVIDQKHLDSIVHQYQPEFVFHLAAQSIVRYSYKVPKLTMETNIMGTVNLLEALRKTESVKACLIITSDKCYENKEWIYSYREVDTLGGNDPYSCSKACAELITASYRKSFFNKADYESSHSAALSSVRAGNIIGGGDWAEDRIIPDCVKALSMGMPIIIRNPSAIRPWLYILDPIYGYLLLGAKMIANSIDYCSAWNFGPQINSKATVEDLVNLVIKYWGNGSYKIDSSPQPLEAGLLQLDSTKAGTFLGWKSLIGIDEAIKRTIEWYRHYYSSKEKLYEKTVNEIHEYLSQIN
ncbi:MAG: CDP-glucose 4,6-dehydratase [Candidatus Fischerbacteria bacterium RBG_13_37_8]|uniref:CDP-glucose 4,6-dehydratase n=1 Tax=Candidatus Fischerbacteria bacterium RBG_13_37_8 TaxID=1817863 RepID=A0A1F5VNR6_9BACT|nr:MAG: CDP-glucose 4,6-dehydratase [Candidatus Fischerbacteria bacterium RBG_13_37_8]